MKRKLEIIIKPVDQFGKPNDKMAYIPAMHSLEPNYSKILELIDEALDNGFETIVIYSKRGFWSRSNIFKNSTWNMLRRDFKNADVRAGMICRRFGQCLGDGFTIYFNQRGA